MIIEGFSGFLFFTDVCCNASFTVLDCSYVGQH
jgi:hypothetical protein